jgi:hypothetical protein
MDAGSVPAHSAADAVAGVLQFFKPYTIAIYTEKSSVMEDDAPKKDVTGSNTFQPPAGIPLKPVGEVTLRHEDKPPEPDEVRRIHPRRPLPLTPDAPPADSDSSREE